MMIGVLGNQETQPPGEKTGYTLAEVDEIDRENKRRTAWRDEWFAQGEDAFKEIQAVRKQTLEKQYELSNLLCGMLDQASMLFATEQWTQDREAFHTPDLRDLHLEANNLLRLPGVHKAGVREMERVAGTADHGQSRVSKADDDKWSRVRNDFDRAHWNRLVARDEFTNMRSHMVKVRRLQRQWMLANEDVREHCDQDELLEGVRRTQALIEAEAQYREAAAAFRRFGQSIATDDSSRFSIISTCPPSITPYWVDLLKERDDYGIAIWRATAPTSKHSKWPQRTSAPQSKIESISIISAEKYDGWSGAWGPAEKPATRSCAWKQENARRDCRLFSRRKRWKADSIHADKDTARIQRDRDGKIPLLHLSGDRKGRWPEGTRPIFHRNGVPKSFSSDVADLIV